MRTLVAGGRSGCFISGSASLIGRVELFPQSSIHHSVIIKGDVNAVVIGFSTNIQDGTVIHEAFAPLDFDHDGSTCIGSFVTIERNCILRGCTIEDDCFVGAGSILEEGSYMEENSMLGPGSVLKKGTRVPAGELWAGNPAKFVRHLSDAQMDELRFYATAQSYAILLYGETYEFDQTYPITLNRRTSLRN